MALSDAIREARLQLGSDEAKTGQATIYAAWEAEARNLESLIEGERLRRRRDLPRGPAATSGGGAVRQARAAMSRPLPSDW